MNFLIGIGALVVFSSVLVIGASILMKKSLSDLSELTVPWQQNNYIDAICQINALEARVCILEEKLNGQSNG